MKFFKSVLPLMVAFSLLLSACNSTSIPSSSVAKATPEKKSLRNDDLVLPKNQGNTNSNLIVDGLVCEKGDWVYYSNPADGNKMYKCLSNGSNKIKLNDDNSMYINVVGNWIYYCNESGEAKIYKMKLDGSSRELFLNVHSGWIGIFDGWMYYQTHSGPFTLSKIRLDGSKKTTLITPKTISEFDGFQNIYVLDGYIYYAEMFFGGDVNEIYRIDINGKNRKTLIKDSWNIRFVLDGDWIYFRSDEGFFKMHLDGSSKSKFKSNTYFLPLNIDESWLYFSNEKGISKMNLKNNQQIQLISKRFSYGLFLTQNWIYYVDSGEETSEVVLYKMLYDGGSNTIVD